MGEYYRRPPGLSRILLEFPGRRKNPARDFHQGLSPRRCSFFGARQLSFL